MSHDLSRVPVTELDRLWARMMQDRQSLEEKNLFYERQLSAGRPVALNALQGIKEALQQSELDQQPLHQEWDERGGWHRVWVDSYGKLHRSPECAKLKPYQHPQILPALSGWDSPKVIEHSTSSVCLQCFPEATEHPAYRRELNRKKREDRCPGSTRKPKQVKQDKAICSVCGQPAPLTPAGRTRTHKKPS